MAKKIVIVNPALTEEHKEPIRRLAQEHGYETFFFKKGPEAYEEIEDAEAGFGFGPDLVQRGKELKWFCTISAGVDAYLKEGVITNPDMILSNSTGAYGVTLAEHTLMVTLELLRKQMTFNQFVAERKWRRYPKFRSIKDSRVTILGTGDLGREAAKRFKGFEPACITGVNRRGTNPLPDVFDRVVLSDEVDSVLPETDILIMCLPGTDKTTHFIDARRIAMLPSHAVVVNVGRGNALDQYALADALVEERIAAAALDVFEKEPLDPEDRLWDTPNLLITPHIGGNMTLGYTVDKCMKLYMEDLDNYLNGRKLVREIDRSRGY